MARASVTHSKIRIQILAMRPSGARAFDGGREDPFDEFDFVDEGPQLPVSENLAIWCQSEPVMGFASFF